MNHSARRWASTPSAPGTMATRCSPGADSETIPTLMGTVLRLQKLAGAEEEPQLGFGRLGGVRTMNAIALDVGGESLANSAFRGFFRIGGAHNFAQPEDSVFALQGH